MNITSTIGICATVLAFLACLGVTYTYYRSAKSKEEIRLIRLTALIGMPVMVSLYAAAYFMESRGMYIVMLVVGYIYCIYIKRKITKIRESDSQIGEAHRA